MKLSTLIKFSQAALNRFGDLECYIDNDLDEEFVTEINSLLCETIDDGSKHILITTYELSESHLKSVK